MMDLPVKMLNHECTGRGVFWKQNYLREYLETNKDFTPANHFVEVCQKLLPCVQDQIESKYLDTVQKAMSHKKIAGMYVILSFIEIVIVPSPVSFHQCIHGWFSGSSLSSV